MLAELRIKDFAIVDECAVQFADDLVALTGETGAGKSIIVDALGLCLGARADSDSVRGSANRTLIEAVFTVDRNSGPLRTMLEEAGVPMDDGDTVILTREIHRGGRSAARINSRAVPLSLLVAAGRCLVDIHGQREHLSILRPDRQLEIIDQYGHLDELRSDFARAAMSLRQARDACASFRSEVRESEQRRDFLRFQVDEIERVAPRPGEDDVLNEERVRLVNAERLLGLASSAYENLQADVGMPGILGGMAQVSGQVTELARIDPRAQSILQAANDVRFAAEDLSASIRHYRDELEVEPGRLDELETRLEEIDRLRRKYGETIDEILRFQVSASEDLSKIEHFEDHLRNLTEDVQRCEAAAADLAHRLSRDRKSSAVGLTEQVTERLAKLGLGNAQFAIVLDTVIADDGLSIGDSEPRRVAFGSTGIDRASFMVSFNLGEEPKRIERVASGGETARFMLAIKAAMATADDIGTMVFDEIDTGVGGRGGTVVGAMMRELGESHQVLTITHLAQIAAQARQHFKVEKQEIMGVTRVVVRELEAAGRKRELAEMLAGASTEGALLSAEELLTSVG